MKKVDVAIIGAGTAGLSARREVRKETQNYVVIDDGPLGTTCARVGCMPSKVLIQVANDFHRRHKLAEQGILGGDTLTIDHRQVMKHVRKLRDRFVRSVHGGMEDWQGTHLIRKRAKFVNENTLDLGDEKIQAKSIIIGTGSKPIIPQPWQKYADFFIDTDGFFELETLPKKVAVIGLGVIGIELGQALSRLGVEVIGLSRGKSIGGLSDPDIQNHMAELVANEFQVSFDGAEVVGTEGDQLVVKAGDQTWKVDKALVTVGRTPSLKNLGLENLNLELDQQGIPRYSSTTLQIPGTRIFVAGDANGQRNLLHEAADEGRIAGYNAVREEAQCFRKRELLAITFSDPNIAIVGKSYSELQRDKTDYVTGEVSFKGFGRAIVMLKEKGMIKVYADRKTGKLLGAEMAAPGGEHMAHLLAWIINLGLNVHDVLSLPFYHPVLEEGLRKAFRDVAAQVEAEPPLMEVFRCQDPPAGSRG